MYVYYKCIQLYGTCMLAKYITTLILYPTLYTFCMYICKYVYIGLDAKYVLDLTDHVWVEIWVESLGRYVYVYYVHYVYICTCIYY